mmetsp:Transcript_96616/g.144657  ORF Transcript_96616/g.144657 Transcript_96616/m.144657 type:complete len:200 (+) Transcript_96616:293-892(+)
MLTSSSSESSSLLSSLNSSNSWPLAMARLRLAASLGSRLARSSRATSFLIFTKSEAVKILVDETSCLSFSLSSVVIFDRSSVSSSSASSLSSSLPSRSSCSRRTRSGASVSLPGSISITSSSSSSSSSRSSSSSSSTPSGFFALFFFKYAAFLASYSTNKSAPATPPATFFSPNRSGLALARCKADPLRPLFLPCSNVG